MALEDIDALSEKDLNADGHVEDHKKIVRGLKSLKDEIKLNTVTPTEFRKRSQSTSVLTKIVPAYNSGHGWTFSGTGVDSTNSSLDGATDFLLGDRAIKLTTLGNGQAAAVTKTLPTPIDVSDCDVRIRFKYNDANLGNVQVIVGNSNFSLASSRTPFTTGGTTDWPWQRNRWEIIDIPQAQFSVGANWTQIQRIQVAVFDINSTPTTVNISSIEFVKRDPFNQGPVICFTFDDSYIGQYNYAKDSLNNRGWKGTIMPIIDRLDSGVSAMTTNNVREMHDVYGWEIGGHSYTNAAHSLGMPAMNTIQRKAELESIQAWQDSYGFRPSTYAYPLGRHDVASEEDVAKYYTTGMTAFAPLLETMTPPRRFAIQRVNVGTQYSQTSSLLNTVIQSNGLLIFCVHDIVTSGGTSNDITLSNWNTLINNVEIAVSNGATVARTDNVLLGIR